MIMLLRKKLINNQQGVGYTPAWSSSPPTPGVVAIGDVTTIMLWVKGNVTTTALITYVLLPSIVALLIPLLLATRKLNGELPEETASLPAAISSHPGKKTIFLPRCRRTHLRSHIQILTHLPPFIGILFVLSLLWIFTEMHATTRCSKGREHRVPQVIAVDMPSILFSSLGILMAVAVLQSAGILGSVAGWLDKEVHNVYIINIVLGVLSSIVDNVPLVAAAMGMPYCRPGNGRIYGQFHTRRHFLGIPFYCAGVKAVSSSSAPLPVS